jgi:glycosyltransferase involved in cell wall biosynthesis
MITTFSIIIPFYNSNPQRLGNLKATLDCLSVQYLGRDPAIDFITLEVILVEQLHINAKTTLTDSDINGVNKHIQLHYDSAFNKSWCMNVAVRNAAYSNLLFIDADNMFGNQYLWMLKEHIIVTEGKQKVFLGFNFHIALPGKDEPICRYSDPSALCTMGGIWFCDKTFYLNEFIGMNENYIGYGGEDNDAYYRMVHLLGINVPRFNYPIVHQYHDWALPSANASPLCLRTEKYPRTVMDKLKKVRLGQLTGPTMINMSDLTL